MDCAKFRKHNDRNVDLLRFYNDSSLKGEGGLLQTLISFKSFGVGIAILTIGLVLMFGKSSQTRDIPMNVLMLLLMSLMLPTIMSDGMKLVKSYTRRIKRHTRRYWVLND